MQFLLRQNTIGSLVSPKSPKIDRKFQKNAKKFGHVKKK